MLVLSESKVQFKGGCGWEFLEMCMYRDERDGDNLEMSLEVSIFPNPNPNPNPNVT